MGIPKLNRYLNDNCSKQSIKKTHLKTLKGKTLVIDTSIYLYKFISNGDLLEQMYLFISILKSYDIIPIFIFDGKPPPEKRELLLKRHNDKKIVEGECKLLEDKLLTIENIEDKEKIETELLLLKKKCIRIKDEDIEKVKELMIAYGVKYIDAEREADELCGYLISNNIAYGCISDDMDMFMYKCKFIIRHLSLLNHTIVLYDYDKICDDLGITSDELTNILLLCGTDYNINIHQNIYEVFKWHKEYNREEGKTFYEWVKENKKDIKICELIKLKELFTITTDLSLNDIEILNYDTNINKDNMKRILEPNGFFWC